MLQSLHSTASIALANQDITCDLYPAGASVCRLRKTGDLLSIKSFFLAIHSSRVIEDWRPVILVLRSPFFTAFSFYSLLILSLGKRSSRLSGPLLQRSLCLDTSMNIRRSMDGETLKRARLEIHIIRVTLFLWACTLRLSPSPRGRMFRLCPVCGYWLLQ